MEVTDIWDDDTQRLLEIQGLLLALGFLQSAKNMFYEVEGVDPDFVSEDDEWVLIDDQPDEKPHTVVLTHTDYRARLSFNKATESIFMSDEADSFHVQFRFRCIRVGSDYWGNPRWRTHYSVDNIRGDFAELKRMMTLAKLVQ